MMKKIYIVITLLLSLTACNNWLDVELDNKVDESKQYSTLQGFKEALAGIYSELSKSNLYGQCLTMEYVDVLAQYYTGVNSTYQYWKDYDYKNSGSAGRIASFWTGLYSNISQANSILEWADKNASVLNESERNQIRGEALGLRAFLHLDLYRLFSPDVKRSPKANAIPYNKIFGVSLPQMYSTEEVIQLVINDLKEAELCLENDPIKGVIPYAIRSTTENGEIIDEAAKDQADKYVARINLYAIKALLARAYQARGDHKTAVQYAKEVVESEKFRLLDFISVDQSETSADLLFSDEHIFSLRNKKLSNYSEQLHKDKINGGSTTRKPLPISGSYAMYQGNDRDVRFSKWYSHEDLIKFIPDTNNIYPQKMPIIKLSEMYLLISECSYGTAPDESMKYLNILRDHRIRGNIHWTFLTKANIYEEMLREYVGEGQMWYVYKRNNMAIPGGSSGTINPSDQIFVFPLPDAEIEDGNR